MAINKDWRKQFFGDEYLVEFYENVGDIKNRTLFGRDCNQLFNIFDIVSTDPRNIYLDLTINWRHKHGWNSVDEYYKDQLYGSLFSYTTSTSPSSLLVVMKSNLMRGINCYTQTFDKIHGYFDSNKNALEDATNKNSLLYGGKFKLNANWILFIEYKTYFTWIL